MAVHFSSSFLAKLNAMSLPMIVLEEEKQKCDNLLRDQEKNAGVQQPTITYVK
jgi:hypothetical protein